MFEVYRYEFSQTILNFLPKNYVKEFMIFILWLSLYYNEKYTMIEIWWAPSYPVITLYKNWISSVNWRNPIYYDMICCDINMIWYHMDQKNLLVTRYFCLIWNYEVIRRYLFQRNYTIFDTFNLLDPTRISVAHFEL